MDIPIDICCFCLKEQLIQEPLIDLNSTSGSRSTYFDKISSTLTNLTKVLNELEDCEYHVCKECSDTIEMIYKFNSKCLTNVRLYSLRGQQLKIKKEEFQDHSIEDPEASNDYSVDSNIMVPGVEIKEEVDDLGKNFMDIPVDIVEVDIKQEYLEEGNEFSSKDKTKITRKRQRHPEKWKCNIRKKLFDQGKEYISIRNKTVPARQIIENKDCVNKCIFKCSCKISAEERKEIFHNYYKLSAYEKRIFIISTTIQLAPERRRKGKNDISSRKKFSYQYYLDVKGKRIQVCNSFYCGTLSISQRPIYTAHKKKNNASDTSFFA